MMSDLPPPIDMQHAITFLTSRSCSALFTKFTAIMANTHDMEKQPLLESQRPDVDQPEPTLSELQQNVFQAQRAYMRAWSRTTSGKWHKRFIFGVTALLLFFMIICVSIIAEDALTEDDGWQLVSKVALEAHIMSKCPDARDCLHDMILPAMQNISHKVDFRLSYIVRLHINPTSPLDTANTAAQGTVTQDDDGVACKHGQEECLGNIIELCAQKHYADPKTFLGFTMCLTKEYQDIPKRELVEDCALEHGISMQTINDCATLEHGAVGLEMLQESFNRSAEAGVSKSCTVRLDEEVRCIRDGGEWTDCEGGSEASDLVRDVEEAYAARWSQ